MNPDLPTQRKPAVSVCLEWLIFFSIWIAATLGLGNRVEAALAVGPLLLLSSMFHVVRIPWRVLGVVFLYAGLSVVCANSYAHSVSMFGGRALWQEPWLMAWGGVGALSVLVYVVSGALVLRDALLTRAGLKRGGAVSILVSLLGLPFVVLPWMVASAALINTHRPKIGNLQTPASLDTPLVFDDLRLRANDGFPISAWYIPADNADKAVVLMHGIGALRSDVLAVAEFLHEGGWAVIMPDMRGHGESGGHTTYLGLREWRDVEACLNFLINERGIPRDRIAGMGLSMGTAALLHAAAHELPLRALVLDAPFASMRVMALAAVPQRGERIDRIALALFDLWGRFDLGASLDDASPQGLMPGLRLPILCFHGEDDSVIPVTESADLLSGYAGPSERIVVPNADHVQSHMALRRAYEQKVLEFLTATLQ